MNDITFLYSDHNDIEIIHCLNSKISYPRHTHISHYTIGLILHGILELHQDTQSLLYHSKDFFIIPPHTAHSLTSPGGTYSMLSISLSKRLIEENNLYTVSQSIQHINTHLIEKRIITSLHSKIIIKAVQYLYAQDIHPMASYNELLGKVQEGLLTHPEKSFSIHYLSEQAFISPYHFIRSFKKQTGLTPHQFQMQNRIRKAKSLLKQNHDITEVALITGFYDQSHLNRCFRKIVGMTPSQYILVQEKLDS